MALDERLLDILICPDCHGRVEHKERRHIVLCLECGARYPVRDGIPTMIIDEATRPRSRGGGGASSPAGD